MKRIILLVACLLVGAGVLTGQEFPAQESWVVDVEGATVLGSVWREGEVTYSLIGGANYLKLFRDDQLVWQCDTLEGAVKNALAVDFGLGDGVELIGVYDRPRDDMRYSTAWNEVVVRFSGGDFSVRSESVEFGGGIQAWSPEYGSEEVRYNIDYLGHFSDNNPDSTRSLVKLRGSQFSQQQASWSSSRLEYHAAAIPGVGEGSSILASAKYHEERSGFEREVREQYSFSFLTYDSRMNMIDSLAADEFITGYEGQSNPLECYGILPLTYNAEQVVALSYNYDDNPSRATFIRLSDLTVVRDLPFAPFNLVVAYRRAGEDSDDDFIIGLDRYDGTLCAFELGNLNEIYRIPGFAPHPLALKVGDYRVDDAYEMLVLTQSRLTCYQLGSLLVQPVVTLSPQSLYFTSFPNPFNSSTTISYTLPRAGWTTMDVMDVSGRLVTRLSDDWKEAGSYREVWNTEGFTSGIYLVRMETQSFSDVRKVTLIR